MSKSGSRLTKKALSRSLLFILPASLFLWIYVSFNHITLDSALSREIDRKWSVQTRGFDGLIVDKNGVIYSAGESLYALDSQGRQRWAYKNIKDFEVQNARIYALREGSVAVLDSKGVEIARFAVDRSASNISIAKNGAICAYNDEELFSVFNASGKQLWKARVQDGTNALFGADGTILIKSIGPDNRQQRTSDYTIEFTLVDRIRAFRPDGVEKWVHVADESINYGPVLGKNGAILYLSPFGDDETMLCSLTPDGAVEWKTKLDGYDSSFAGIGEDGTVFVENDGGKFTAVSWKGKRLWSLPLTGKGRAVTDRNGIIYVANTDWDLGHPNWLYAIKPNGKLLWKRKAGYGVLDGLAIDEQGGLYICNGSGEICAVDSE